MLGKEKEGSRETDLRFGLQFGPTQRPGGGGKGGGRGLAGRAGRPAGGGLLAAKVLLGRGLALGSAQSARKRALVAVYSCSRSTAGWWTVGSVLVDSDHLLSSYLRFAVHQVQIGLPLHLRTVADRGALRRGGDQPRRRAVALPPAISCPSPS